MSTPRLEPVLPGPEELRSPPVAGPPPGRARRIGFWAGWIVLFLVLLPPGVVLALRWVPPPVTAFMLQSETQPVLYQWVPADRIADVARRAVVAAEDQKFWTHEGFDFEAIEKALENNQKKNRRIRGASTISQQTAKNLFLWPGGGYLRKAVEASFTVLMEKFWGKERILEVYLNVAEFGPGIYGVEAASQRYFGKPAARLGPEEAARLAAVLPSPRRWSVSRPGPYVQKRAGWILRQMGYGRAPEPPPEVEPGLESEPEPELPVDADDALPEAPPEAGLPDALEPEPPPMEDWPLESEATPAPAPAP